jgi:hypothetical protein
VVQFCPGCFRYGPELTCSFSFARPKEHGRKEKDAQIETHACVPKHALACRHKSLPARLPEHFGSRFGLKHSRNVNTSSDSSSPTPLSIREGFGVIQKLSFVIASLLLKVKQCLFYHITKANARLLWVGNHHRNDNVWLNAGLSRWAGLVLVPNDRPKPTESQGAWGGSPTSTLQLFRL